jgi:hypothetical protein
MSDTPRTDAAWSSGFDPVILSAAELARRLKEQCAELEHENAALREDRDRLVKTASEVLEAFILHKKVETGHPCPENMCICIDLRAAIDSARAKEAKS